MKKLWFACAVLAGSFAVGCGGCGGDAEKAPVDAGGEPLTQVELPPVETPSDPVLAEVAALAARVSGLPEKGGADQAPRELFRREALTLGNAAIGTLRIDAVVGVATALWQAGEVESAAAFLQRAVGITREKATTKEHVHALARLKVELGSELEAASLMERAIDVEPTTVDDFVLLSWAYLRAGRIGPAAAATKRGLGGHAGAPELAVQAAEVTLVKSGAEAALTELAAITLAPDSAHFLRVRGEAQLVAGNRDAAGADAKALTSAHPRSPWGPLLTAALGGGGRSDALAKAKALAGLQIADADARAALSWAEAAGDSVSVWKRGEPRVPVAVPAVPAGEAVPATPGGGAVKPTAVKPAAAKPADAATPGIR